MKTKPIPPKPATQTAGQGHFKYYKVFYSKDVNKKKRVFSQGILACENKKTRLFNSDGEVLVQVLEKNTPEIDEEYVIGYKYSVVIDSEIEKEDFTTGKVFISIVNGENLPVKKSQSNQIKQKKKIKQNPNNPQSSSNQSSSQLLTGTFNKDTTQLQNGLQIQNMLYSKLRQHQIAGVQFMYDCLLGFKSASICGCILADFMGLGKTLQTITLIYSLLKMKKIHKCIVISPLTLVYVWQKQCKKWLDNKLNPLVALGDGEEVKNVCKQFATNQYRVLVLSYQGFYRFIDILEKKCDLIVFDQGHRLKNKNSKVYKKILNFSCRKRVLLTGTPLQNNLQQLYTCISIVNPSLFGSEQLFNNVFQKPILKGMARKATQLQRKIAVQRTLQLANKIKEFSLRRKADTLQKYLPIKRQYFVLFRLTPLQKLWYQRLLVRKQSESDVLGFLNLFRKLFTHPQILKNYRLQKDDLGEFTEDTIQEVSYKINFLLDVCERQSKKGEKVIIVSYFTSTLDFVGKLLKEKGITWVKLDGKVDGKERQTVVTAFEKEKSVLLLSGKAGGTGLTLVCARTMIMLQPDWNPSNDSQVIGRIWRQGQTQQVSIYRLIMVSSFQQRIIQRQNLKNSLSQKLIDEKKSPELGYDFMDMKKLFVKSSEKSIIFGNEGNVLEQVYAESGLRLEGVVLVACKQSHSGVGKGEMKGKGEQRDKVDTNNEFADGMLLVEGLIEEEQQEEVQKQVQDCFDNQDISCCLIQQQPNPNPQSKPQPQPSIISATQSNLQYYQNPHKLQKRNKPQTTNQLPPSTTKLDIRHLEDQQQQQDTIVVERVVELTIKQPVKVQQKGDGIEKTVSVRKVKKYEVVGLGEYRVRSRRGGREQVDERIGDGRQQQGIEPRCTLSPQNIPRQTVTMKKPPSFKKLPVNYIEDYQPEQPNISTSLLQQQQTTNASEKIIRNEHNIQAIQPTKQPQQKKTKESKGDKGVNPVLNKIKLKKPTTN